MERDAQVTAVIPTTCSVERRDTLWRAIESLRSGNAVLAHIVIVANGGRIDPELLRELKSDVSLAVHVSGERGIPMALLTGRREVNSAFFCFLDDDDEYLPGAIDARLTAAEREPAADVVVTNGWRQALGKRAPAFFHFGEVEGDPLSALFRENWLASCGGLYRTDSVGVELFEHLPPYVEWTWLAFRLARSGLKIRVHDAPTFVIHDTPGSASKSDAYAASYIGLFERMLAEGLPQGVEQVVRRRLGEAWHDVSGRSLARGDLGGALRAHMRSLVFPGGVRYLSYTARLLGAAVGLGAAAGGRRRTL